VLILNILYCRLTLKKKNEYSDEDTGKFDAKIVTIFYGLKSILLKNKKCIKSLHRKFCSRIIVYLIWCIKNKYHIRISRNKNFVFVISVHFSLNWLTLTQHVFGHLKRPSPLDVYIFISFQIMSSRVNDPSKFGKQKGRWHSRRTPVHHVYIII